MNPASGTVWAEEYNDYTKGVIPENMIPVDSNNSPMRTYISEFTRNNGGVQGTNLLTDRIWSNNAKMWSRSILWAQRDVTENILHGFTGWNYKKTKYEVGKSYVFRLKQVKRKTDVFSYNPSANDTKTVIDATPADVEVRIGLALTNEIANGSTTTYSKEYGKAECDIFFEDALENGTIVKAFIWDGMRPIENVNNFGTTMIINTAE